MELIIASRLYSTWSLRPWLVLKRAGAVFDVTAIDVYSPEGQTALARVSPSGFAPLLKVEGEMIWDSLAICEWCADRWPEAKLWPADPTARALARSAASEMHAGFAVLRTDCGMGPDHTMVGDDRSPPPTGEAVGRDLRRIVSLWGQFRGRFGAEGSWLFGAWSIADAFFTPVAARLRHFQIDLSAYGDDGTAAAYRDALLAQPDFLQWSREALAPQ